MKQILVLGLTFLGMISFSNLQAKELPTPTGRVILTVTGAISNVNTASGTAEFDRQMLVDLGMVRLETKTPWSEGVDLYEGPLLRSLIEAVGANSDTLSVKALNDYSALVPVKDSVDHDVILAIDMNGEVMRIRDKGPIFVLYPFDTDPSLNNEVIYNRSVWQIKAINVE
jgi:hypothetical protein